MMIEPPPIAATVKSLDAWGEPKPLKRTLRRVEKLDPGILPDVIRSYSLDVASRMGCPLEFVAVPVIVVVSSVIGAACGIRPKQFDSWLVISNLWGAIIGRPGIMKSPALAEPLSLLERLEDRESQKFASEELLHEFEAETFKAEKAALADQIRDHAKSKASKKVVQFDKGAASEELRQKFVNLIEPSKPVKKRLRTNDATIPKLGELLKDNPRGILQFRDEITGMLASLDREDRIADRKFMLETWNGYGKYFEDRVGRGSNEIPNMCVSVLGGIQPSKLRRYLNQAVSDLGNDGLMQRFQLLVFPDEVEWKLTDRSPNKPAKDALFDVLACLANQDFALWGKVDEPGDIPYFRFDDDAQEIFYKWLTELETGRLRDENEANVLVEHLSKYRSLMPSVALIFHLVEMVSAPGLAITPVSADAAEKAVQFCAFLESHARRIYGMVTDTTDGATEELARHLETGDLKNEFSVRDIRRKGWAFLGNKEAVEAACARLESLGWLKRHQRFATSKGGRPTSIFTINPTLTAD